MDRDDKTVFKIVTGVGIVGFIATFLFYAGMIYFVLWCVKHFFG